MPDRVEPGEAEDPERSAVEGARRARTRVRRFCAANRLNRLGTLTYRGAGCHDPKALRSDLGVFFRRLRAATGGRAFPYLWVPEWHKTDHGLHAHFAVGRFIPRGLIEESWGHGFVHIKLLGDLPAGTGPVGEARRNAGYLSKYVGKSFEDDRRIPGLHRYEVAQGFQPERRQVWALTRDSVIAKACEIMRASPEHVWTSDEVEDWQAPPAVWVSWAG